MTPHVHKNRTARKISLEILILSGEFAEGIERTAPKTPTPQECAEIARHLPQHVRDVATMQSIGISAHAAGAMTEKKGAGAGYNASRLGATALIYEKRRRELLPDFFAWLDSADFRPADIDAALAGATGMINADAAAILGCSAGHVSNARAAVKRRMPEELREVFSTTRALNYA